jgi:hypothetical protein
MHGQPNSFTTARAKLENLTVEIKRNEVEIDPIVYKLFDLAPKSLNSCKPELGLVAG